MEFLVRQAMRGDWDAFASLIDKHKESMYKTAWIFLRNDQDAADAISETILTCYEKLPTLNNPAAFKPWLLRILKNKCFDILRQAGRTDFFDEPPVSVPFHDQAFDQIEWKELLKCLDPVSAEIMELHYFDNLSASEIGEVMEMNRNTVLTRLKRAKKRLQEEYGIQ